MAACAISNTSISGWCARRCRSARCCSRAAPHIMWPLRFVMPHMPHLRPAWMIRAGLFLYDHLARRDLLPGSARLDLRAHPAGAPLQSFDHARLRLLRRLGRRRAPRRAERARRARARRDDPARARAASARERATAHGTRSSSDARRRDASTCRRAPRQCGRAVGRPIPARTRAAARDAHSVRLVKGSHIVVPRLFEHVPHTSSRTPTGASSSRFRTSATSR